MDWRAAPLAEEGVAQGLVHVEIADRIAELVGLGVLVYGLARAAKIGVVLAELVLSRDLKQLFERLVLHAANALGRDGVFPLGVLLDIAALMSISTTSGCSSSHCSR